MANELDIPHLRELLAKPTKGEWWAPKQSGAEPGPYVLWACDPLPDGVLIASALYKCDAAFIVAAHKAFPALLDAAETRDVLRISKRIIRKLSRTQEQPT